jgi:hypothetical protein
MSLFVAGCGDVTIEDPDGAGGAGGQNDASTSSSSSGDNTTSSSGMGGAGTGGEGEGGRPAGVPVCSTPDTFDDGVLDPAQWSAFPRGSFSLVEGAVDLHGELAYLKLLVEPKDCAFTFEIDALPSGRVSLQIVGNDGSLIDVRTEDGTTAAFQYDGASQTGDFVEAAETGTPLGLGLLFQGAEISCVARYESGWHLITTFPSPAWFDEENPEVRFVDIDGNGAGSVRIDDYGIHPVYELIVRP